MTAFIQMKTLLLGTMILVLLLSGCSTVPITGPDTEEPQRTFKAVVGVHQSELPAQISDPIEGFNRGTYRFNYYFDKFIFLPVVAVYEFILPNYVQKRVSNFVDNVYEFNNFTNNLLQLKFKQTGITVGRVAINTTVGIFGLWDPATHWGIRRQPEDFGQTLGHYGVGHGPYIVLPILGPSNLRDTTGTVADSLAFKHLGPPAWVDDDDIELAFSLVAAVDKRHRTPFRYYKTGSPFEYELIRMLYTSQREIVISK